MTSVADLIAKQATDFGLIKRAVVNLNKLGRGNITASIVRSRLRTLQSYWDQCRATHSVITSTAPEDVKRVESYFVSNQFGQANEDYEQASDYMSDLLEKLTTPIPQQTLDESLSNIIDRDSHSPLQLPRINLPPFSGNYADWPNFHDVFKALVIENRSLSKVQKLYYLKSTLSGEASLLLKNVAVTECNFQSAWDLLTKRYNSLRSLVHALLQDFLNIAPLTSTGHVGLKNLRDKSADIRTALINLQRPVNEWEDLFNFIIISKLDTTTRREWEVAGGDDTQLPTYEKLDEFLTSRIRANEAMQNSDKSISAKKENHSQRFIRSHFASQNGSSCIFCRELHPLFQCTQYKALTPLKRREFLKEHHCCLNCLRQNHGHQQCRSSNSCFRCHKRHHTTIHESFETDKHKFKTNKEVGSHCRVSNVDARRAVNTPSTSADSGKGERTTVSNNNFANSKLNAAVLPTAYIVLHAPTGRSLCVRALLDQGSQYSFITESVAQFLKLQRKSVKPVTVTGIADAKAGVVNSIATLTLSPCDNEKISIPLEALVMKKLTSYSPRMTLEADNFTHLRDLDLADPEPFDNRKIDVLLGAELFSQLLLPGLRKGPSGTPIAQCTIFGWIISGPTKNVKSKFTSQIHVNHAQNADLESLLKKFWEIEEFPEPSAFSPEEIECEKHFLETHSRTSEGRYIVRIPFKSNQHKAIGNTKEIAARVLLSNEKRLIKNPNLLKEYQAFLQEYLELKHMSEVNSDEREKQNTVYLPHHPVIREVSQTTKLRVVFNASKRSSNGVTLNELQHIGAKLQADLAALLLRWRRHRFVYTADIEKMFRQILVDSRDVHHQQILWRENLQSEIKTYQLLTVTYGTASAPFLANRVIKQLASDESEKYPLAATILNHDVYVDDVMFGADDENHAKHLREQLTRLLTAGGFHLYKWASNSKSLLSEVADAPHAIAVDRELKPDEQLKVLGLNWIPASDSFNFSLNLDQQAHFSKRSFLSLISRIFDPLGWITPFTITGKIIIQELWLCKVKWDSKLPEAIQKKCLHYQEQLNFTHKLYIPRWINVTNNSNSFQLHGFSDASEKAYAASVYLRIEDSNDSVKTFLLIAKSKVAPLKLQSIPRLELCGARLLIQLLEYVIKHLTFNSITTYCWTDSSVVLHWLRQHPSRWKTFVANRVSKIQTSTCKTEWRHVASKDNPADCASRGVDVSELVTSQLWWQGPPWLQKSLAEWPSQLPLCSENITECEAKPQKLYTHVCKTDPEFNLLHKFSDLDKLLRVTAYVFRFIRHTREKFNHSHNTFLAAEEIENARNYLIKMFQNSEFREEIKALKKGSKISKNSKLYKLTPFIDENSILRVGGRLRNSSMPESFKHPILLGHGHFTSLLISKVHKQTLHGGVQLMLRVLSQNYWIISARIHVKRHIRNCVKCVRFKAAIPKQQMSDLPAARIQPSRPFTHTGIDYAGPFRVRAIGGRGKTSHKCYISLFVCLATKAVHLELVYDYSTAAFLAALSRFAARRGLPSVIYSDNGTNFQGADSELRKHFLSISKDPNLQNKIASDAIAWRFIPPAAPHFGGLWEAGVKSVKHHLRRILGDFCPTAEEFTTLLCGIESCLNSRPLTVLHDDTDNFEAMTPGHFLVGSLIKAIPEQSLLDTNINRLSRWQTLQLFHQRFWRLWQTDYLTSLQARQKWSEKQENLKIGNVVLLRNNNLPPSKWELGKVIDIFPGKDNLTRVVKLKTAASVYTRPITQLCLLPVEPKPNESA